MRLSNFDDWLELCATSLPPGAEDPQARESRLWQGFGISPPPFSDPTWRVPLQMAQRCIWKFRGVKTTAAKRKHLQWALRWLSHPHPRSSAAIRGDIRRKEEEVLILLQDLRPKGDRGESRREVLVSPRCACGWAHDREGHAA